MLLNITRFNGTCFAARLMLLPAALSDAIYNRFENDKILFFPELLKRRSSNDSNLLSD
jgi:hypothetical protein